MKKTNEALHHLIKRQEQLSARIQTLRAREAIQQRKDETRRKILVGAYILEKHEKAGSLDKLVTELDCFLFRPTDRALFGLLPKEEIQEQT